MISGLPPALLFLAGAAVVPLLPQRFKQAFMLALPLFALYALYVTPWAPIGASASWIIRSS